MQLNSSKALIAESTKSKGLPQVVKPAKVAEAARRSTPATCSLENFWCAAHPIASCPKTYELCRSAIPIRIVSIRDSYLASFEFLGSPFVAGEVGDAILPLRRLTTC
jgi:hypothetical protein